MKSKGEGLEGMTKPESMAIVIPIFNEESCIDELIRRLLRLRSEMEGIELSFLFVNDGSYDRSLDLLLDYAGRYDFLKVISLSRNFGHQMAITAGLDHAEADYVAIIDGDLQDPPELIKELYEKMKEGYDIVYAQRTDRKGESFFKLATARLFYSLINKLCHVQIPPNTGDFRLINGKLLRAFKGMRETHRFVRGMVPWLGFKGAPVLYTRDKRYAGETKYPFTKMLTFALDAIFSFSNTPLRIATYLGLSIVLLGILGVLLILYLRLFTDYYVPGITAAILAIVILGGLQIIMIGVVGEYVGRIFEQSKNRPLYVVDFVKNLSSQA